MIEIKNIFKTYRNGLSYSHILRDVSLTIGEGEFVSIQGPSGAGKTTLLNIMGTIDEPTEGEYYFQDQPVHKLTEKQRTQLHRQFIGFVFQAYHLIDDLTVYENLEMPLLYKKVKTSERKSQVADMLDRFGIVAKKDLFPSQLSGGQQQLVGIARALIIHPRLILADEPTGNLQSKQGEQIMDILKELNREEGVTIVQVTHSEKFAEYGNRVIELVDGRVMEDRKTVSRNQL